MAITLLDESVLNLLDSAVDAHEGSVLPSSLDLLKEWLAAKFPDAQFEVRKPKGANDVHFLNIYHGELEVAVEWNPGRKFGVSCFEGKEDELGGLYAAPDEWFKSTEAVYHRIASLLLEKEVTRNAATNLAQIRQALGVSQTSLSALLAVQQATYSKLERRGDVKVSTLRKVIEAMGGILKIEARFPESQNVRELSL